MSNMGDCRFENTCCDLLDCLDALRQYQPVSESEYRAAYRMIRHFLCFCKDAGIIRSFDHKASGSDEGGARRSADIHFGRAAAACPGLSTDFERTKVRGAYIALGEKRYMRPGQTRGARRNRLCFTPQIRSARCIRAEKPWIFSSFMDISSLLMGAQPKAA